MSEEGSNWALEEVHGVFDGRIGRCNLYNKRIWDGQRLSRRCTIFFD